MLWFLLFFLMVVFIVDIHIAYLLGTYNQSPWTHEMTSTYKLGEVLTASLGMQTKGLVFQQCSM